LHLPGPVLTGLSFCHAGNGHRGQRKPSHCLHVTSPIGIISSMPGCTLRCPGRAVHRSGVLTGVSTAQAVGGPRDPCDSCDSCDSSPGAASTGALYGTTQSPLRHDKAPHVDRQRGSQAPARLAHLRCNSHAIYTGLRHSMASTSRCGLAGAGDGERAKLRHFDHSPRSG
jgi:hypothetical protein